MTSAVLWLISYNLRIQCFKATLFKLKGQVLLDLKQIIPTLDTAKCMVHIAEKNSAETRTVKRNDQTASVRQEFWAQLLEQMNRKSLLL